MTGRNDLEYLLAHTRYTATQIQEFYRCEIQQPFEITVKCLRLGSTFISDDLVFVPEGHPATNRFLQNRHCLFVTILIYIFISRGFREVFVSERGTYIMLHIYFVPILIYIHIYIQVGSERYVPTELWTERLPLKCMPCPAGCLHQHISISNKKINH